MNHPRKLRTIVCASIMFAAPTLLIAADDSRYGTSHSTDGSIQTSDNTTTGTTDSRSAATTAKDAAITAKVKTKLLADPDVSGMKIDVDTRSSAVSLSGTAASEAQMVKAASLAAQVDGVSTVTNRLTVVGSVDGSASGDNARTVGTTAKDAAITASVKTKLLADSDVSGTRIDVDTRNKVVTLSGTVASQTQVARAETLARTVDGVTTVSNRLAVAK